MKTLAKTVLVFGVFDLLHPGHSSFLMQAKRKGKKLVVVVARDKAVKALKNKKPHHSERIRLRAVTHISFVTRAVLGDSTQGAYTAIRRYAPDLICFGYDQHGLRQDIRAHMRAGLLPSARTMTLRAHHPEQYKTSLMQKHKPIAK